jgi:hypothetical protein
MPFVNYFDQMASPMPALVKVGASLGRTFVHDCRQSAYSLVWKSFVSFRGL